MRMESRESRGQVLTFGLDSMIQSISEGPIRFHYSRVTPCCAGGTGFGWGHPIDSRAAGLCPGPGPADQQPGPAGTWGPELDLQDKDGLAWDYIWSSLVPSPGPSEPPTSTPFVVGQIADKKKKRTREQRESEKGEKKKDGGMGIVSILPFLSQHGERLKYIGNISENISPGLVEVILGLYISSAAATTLSH